MRILESTENSIGVVVVKIDYKGDELKNIIKWCKQHECGKQVSLQRFAFKKEELTMFQLRWES